jgi:glucose dehydrogenase
MSLKASSCVWLLGATVLLGACGSDQPKPTPLEPLTPKIAGRQVWQAKLSGVQFPLAVAARDGNFVMASDDGTVLALEAASGREIWRAQVGAPIAAGVGTDGRFTAVVTRSNEVITLEQDRVVWKARLPGRVLTAPLVAGERVFVMGVDRVVHALDALDGKKLWALQRPGDALTLGQGGVVAAFAESLVRGVPPVFHGDGRQTRDFVFIDDVVDALVRAAQRGSGLVINVGTGTPTSIRDLWAALAGPGAPRALVGEPTQAGVARCSLSPTRARIHLSWASWTDLNAGLAQLDG